MKYLESYKLFERVTVPDFETSTNGNDSKGCGNCLAAKSGESLISPPKQTYQNLNRPSSEGQQINPYEVEKQKFFKKYQGAEGDINKVFNSAKNWYTGHYMKPETLKKFKNKQNRIKLVDFINERVKMMLVNRNSDPKMSMIWEEWGLSNCIGWVWSDRFDQIELNMEKYEVDPDYKETIPHELGHCIYFKLEQLGEDPISGNEDASKSISPNFRGGSVNPSLSDEENTKIKDTEIYLTDEDENQTRLMSLRRLLNIGPLDTCQEIKQKFESNIKNGKLKFRYLILSEFVKKQNEDCYWLKLKVPDKYKGWITDPKFYIGGKPRLALIYDLLKCSFNGEDNLDFPRLFSVFSEYKDGFIWLNLSKLTQLNIDVVTNDSPKNFDKMG